MLSQVSISLFAVHSVRFWFGFFLVFILLFTNNCIEWEESDEEEKLEWRDVEESNGKKQDEEAIKRPWFGQ